MKKQTQKPAPASPKARRKPDYLRLDAEAALALNLVITRLEAETQTLCPGSKKYEGRDSAQQRRFTANRLLTQACEALLALPGSILHGWAWWTLDARQMDESEVSARAAIIDSLYTRRSLDPIDDATEAAAIQTLQAGKSTAARQSGPSEAAPGIAPAVRCVDCIEREGEKDNVLFGLDMRPHGWQRIQEMLAESPEVKILFRIERGEKKAFTGWRFVTVQDDPETDDED